MRYFRYFSMIILLLTVFSVCCLGTSEKITIQSFEFYEYVDQDNDKNQDLLTAKFEFSSPIDAKQFSILLMSDNLTTLNSTNVGKVIYIDQFPPRRALASDAVVLTDEQRAEADVYSDGSINISDLILLQQHLASPDITLGPAK